MIPLFKVTMASEAGEAVSRVLASGYVGQGARVDAFEEELQAAISAPTRPVSTNSCTSAITIALMLCDVGPGDEVITTPITCTATNTPIILAGARPVWADVDPITGNIDPEDVARKITPRTKAIIAVDWSGRPCDYDHLRRISGFVPIIQDAAHTPFPVFGGDYACMSFGPIKHLSCGDGGALVVTGNRFEPDAQIASARLLRWYGLDRDSKKSFRCEQDIARVGGKYHMTDINAAIGLANLPHAYERARQHYGNAFFYGRYIVNRSFARTPPASLASPWWVYTMVVSDRESFSRHMASYGIETSQVHARNDKHSGMNYPNGELPGVDHFDAHQVSIPCGWWVTSEQRRHIIKAVNDWTP